MTPPAALAQTDTAIQTPFGEFSVPSPQVVTFTEGLPGFEACERFVVIVADELRPLSCLHGLDEPAPSFLAAPPGSLRPDFQPTLSVADRALLDVQEDDRVLWLVLLTLGAEGVTANLKAPIAINPRTMTGRQVILDDPALPVAWTVEIR